MSPRVVIIGGVVVFGAVGALLAWLMFASVQPSQADLDRARAVVVDAGPPAADAPAVSPHAP